MALMIGDKRINTGEKNQVFLYETKIQMQKGLEALCLKKYTLYYKSN